MIFFLRRGLASLKLTAKAPENKPLEKEIPIGNHNFLGAMLVLGSVALGTFQPKSGRPEK